MQAHTKRLRLPAIAKCCAVLCESSESLWRAFQFPPPVPQGAEYGGLCRRRHNARAECRAAPALFRRPTRYGLPSEIVFTPHGAPPRFLCLRAVRSCEAGFVPALSSAYKICAAPLRLLYAAQETERFLGCLRVGRMCADIWSGFAFPVPLLPSKKCELEGAITARCFIYPNGTALLLRTVGRTRLPRGSCGCKSRRRGSVKYTCGTPKAACFTQKSGLGTVPGLFLSALPTRLA